MKPMKLTKTPKSVSDARRRLEQAQEAFYDAIRNASAQGYSLRAIAQPARHSPETIRSIVNGK